MTKACRLCKQQKSVTEFNVRRGSKDGLQFDCRECNKQRCRGYYAANKPHHLAVIRARNKAYRAAIKAEVDAFKKSVGCMLCGEPDLACLDFHHRDKKNELVSRLIGGGHSSRRRCEAEIRKCSLVCANCHRKIHAGSLSDKNLPLCDFHFESTGRWVRSIYGDAASF